MLSCDNLCKQFVTLKVFLKEFNWKKKNKVSKKDDMKKYQMTKKRANKDLMVYVYYNKICRNRQI